MGLASDKATFKPQIYHLCVKNFVIYWKSLSLSFLIYKMEVLIVPISWF